MKGLLFAIALTAGFAAGPAGAAAWTYQSAYVQAPQKDRGGPGRGYERGDGDRGRDVRNDRREERRDRMTDEERRALHRDLDKANRELYGRRQK